MKCSANEYFQESINFCGACGQDDHRDTDRQINYQEISIRPETGDAWCPRLFDALTGWGTCDLDSLTQFSPGAGAFGPSTLGAYILTPA